MNLVISCDFFMCSGVVLRCCVASCDLFSHDVLGFLVIQATW